MTAPEDGDTDDLRSGAPLHDRLLAVLPLVGTWQGTGTGQVAGGSTFHYHQQVRFVHDGRPFLAYDSRSWLINDVGAVIRPAWRESGFWRPGTEDDDLEVALASSTGQAMVFAGRSGDLRWEFASTSLQPTATAVRVDGERRLYALLDGRLVYATELAPAAGGYAPHLNAELSRR